MTLITLYACHYFECYYAECWVSRFMYCYAEYYYTACVYADCHYAEHYYAKCHFAECRDAKCLSLSNAFHEKNFFPLKWVCQIHFLSKFSKLTHADNDFLKLFIEFIFRNNDLRYIKRIHQSTVSYLQMK